MRTYARHLIAGAIACAPLHAFAQQAGENEIGIRGAIRIADGEPANDITGFGGMFRHYLDDGWAWGIALDAGEFDFEEPARILGIAQDPDLEAIDAKADVFDASVFLERHTAWNERWSWFWQLGAGLGSVDVPRASGPRADGGSFDIETDAKTEAFLLGGLGIRRSWDRLSVEGALTAQYRFADYELVDTVSGTSATVDDYQPLGIYVGLLYRF